MSKKKKDKQEMFEYTYRDMGQELIMKRKMVRAIIFSIITLIALAVFIALYIEETQRVQETYRKQYKSSLITISEEIQFYLDAEGDYEFRYRHVTADLDVAATFATLIKDFDEEQKAMTQLYSAYLKYPQQMSERMETVKQAIDDIINNLDKGYDEVREIIAGLDLKGY